MESRRNFIKKTAVIGAGISIIPNSVFGMNKNQDKLRSFTRKKIKIRRVKYLNNIIEQDYRSIKRRIAISTGFKEFEVA